MKLTSSEVDQIPHNSLATEDRQLCTLVDVKLSIAALQFNAVKNAAHKEESRATNAAF